LSNEIANARKLLNDYNTSVNTKDKKYIISTTKYQVYV
jgi:hypothetical protein